MLRLPVVYIRGLNTYGDEGIHFGPWSWKTMDYYWLELFKKKGIHAIGLRGWAGPSLDAHLENAEKEFIRSLQSHDRVHLVGHSMGGLVARSLGKKFPDRVASISTISTPHKGSLIAKNIFSAANLKTKLVKHGYRNHPFAQCLWDLDPDVIIKKFPENEASQIPNFGFTFDIPYSEMSRAVQLVHNFVGTGSNGDGFVDLESQKWGTLMGPYALDHMDQLGLFLHLNPKKRNLKRERFHRLVEDVIENLQTIEKNPI